MAKGERRVSRDRIVGCFFFYLFALSDGELLLLLLSHVRRRPEIYAKSFKRRALCRERHLIESVSLIMARHRKLFSHSSCLPFSPPLCARIIAEQTWITSELIPRLPLLFLFFASVQLEPLILTTFFFLLTFFRGQKWCCSLYLVLYQFLHLPLCPFLKR